MDVLEKVRATLGTYTGTDVRAMLKEDHEVILEIAKELAESTSSARRRALVTRLKPLLVAHSRAEEQAVYVPLTKVAGSPDSRMAGNEGAVEHNLADTVLGRLADTEDASSDMWKAHAKVLHELLEHHIEEEQDQVFEELGEHFTDAQRDAMGEQFARRKEAVLEEMAGAARRGKRA
jgi:hemerythrin superfamily protein